MVDVLLQTKLHRPTRSLAQRPFIVPRPQLNKKLNTVLSGKMTLVSAPAGFGKTTVVTTWLDTLTEKQIGIGWLSLDEGDNVLVRFLTYLVAALQTAVPSMGETITNLLQSPQPLPSETILTLLINDISQNDQPLILVMDDYHTITTSAIHQALAFFLDHLPSQLHLLIITRSDPPLPLSRLRARRQMVEIRTNDLRFSLAEPEGYVRLFVDEGEPMAALLRQVRLQGIFPDYIDKLLSAFPAAGSKLEVANLLPEPLSEREMEVLQLVATGAFNRDIAEQLFIALSTVKKHMNLSSILGWKPDRFAKIGGNKAKFVIHTIFFGPMTAKTCQVLVTPN